jgi:hypothetical protein
MSHVRRWYAAGYRKETTMAKNAKPTAEQAYQGCQNDVGELLDLIGQEMKQHAEFAEKDALNWGHVGDVHHVRRCLIETLAQLAQQDEAFIEKHLEEMREDV